MAEPEEIPQTRETINGEEGLVAAAKNFQWVSPEKTELGGYKSNWQVIEEAVKTLKARQRKKRKNFLG